MPNFEYYLGRGEGSYSCVDLFRTRPKHYYSITDKVRFCDTNGYAGEGGWCWTEWDDVVLTNIPMRQGHAYRVLGVSLVEGSQFLLRPSTYNLYFHRYNEHGVADWTSFGDAPKTVLKDVGIVVRGQGKRFNRIRLRIKEVKTVHR